MNEEKKKKTLEKKIVSEKVKDLNDTQLIKSGEKK